MKPAVFLLLLSTPALACFDRDAKPIPNPAKALREYERNNRSFSTCLDKLADAGVDLGGRDLRAWRKDRNENDDGPVAYSILIQGRDVEGRQTRMRIEYNLRKHRYVCEDPTHNIPRCF